MKKTIILLIALVLTACTTAPIEKRADATNTLPAVSPVSTGYSSESYHVGPRPTDIVCTDLDGDGYNDIATALKKQTLVVMLNNQKGEFLEPVKYDTMPHNTSLTAADIDGDGDIDLIPLTELMVGPIFLNDGKGHFTRHDLNIKSIIYSWHIESADLNNDNLPDLVITSLQKPLITIVMNKGNLNFEPHRINLMPDKSLPHKSSTKPRIEDLKSMPQVSSDEKLASEKTEQIITDVEDRSGSQKWRYAKRIRALANGFKDIKITDINGDGYKDIITPSYVMGALYIGINDGKGNFNFTSLPIEPKQPYELSYALSSVAILKYPGRELPDVAVSSERDGKIYIFENKDGNLSQKETLETNTRALIRITSDDMNGDGLPDIIATFTAPLPADTKSPVQVWLNSKNGFFLHDNLRSEGFGAYVNTCRIKYHSAPSIVTSNIHEETLTIFKPFLEHK